MEILKETILRYIKDKFGLLCDFNLCGELLLSNDLWSYTSVININGITDSEFINTGIKNKYWFGDCYTLDINDPKFFEQLDAIIYGLGLIVR